MATPITQMVGLGLNPRPAAGLAVGAANRGANPTQMAMLRTFLPRPANACRALSSAVRRFAGNEWGFAVLAEEKRFPKYEKIFTEIGNRQKKMRGAIDSMNHRSVLKEGTRMFQLAGRGISMAVENNHLGKIGKETFAGYICAFEDQFIDTAEMIKAYIEKVQKDLARLEESKESDPSVKIKIMQRYIEKLDAEVLCAWIIVTLRDYHKLVGRGLHTAHIKLVGGGLHTAHISEYSEGYRPAVYRLGKDIRDALDDMLWSRYYKEAKKFTMRAVRGFKDWAGWLSFIQHSDYLEGEFAALIAALSIYDRLIREDGKAGAGALISGLRILLGMAESSLETFGQHKAGEG